MALSYGVASFLTNYCVWKTLVDGNSMNPALEDGDTLLVDRMTYQFQQPERFDIIVFPQEIDLYYVKRIIGLPGETVEIVDGTIYIDGTMLEENYGKEPMKKNASMEKILLSENEYFVLGDNRNNSLDSRSDTVGLIQRDEIVGKASVIIYPFENLHIFK